MVSLRIMPPPVSSASELMSMARAMEQEAARHYRDLAARMRLRQQDGLAQLFAFLSEIEEKHVVKIENRAAHVLAHPLSRMPPGWEVPETFGEEEAASRLLTPYRALALAVRNEDRAFAFYSYIAADAPDEATRKLAEELAKDELEHAHLLRRERRTAYRTEGPIVSSGQAAPETLTELWTAAAEAENRAAAYHNALAAVLAPEDERLAALFEHAADDEADCAREAASRTGAIGADRSPVEAPPVEGGLRLLEEGFELYSDIAERAGDESVMREAQSLAARAVRRLSLVFGSMNYEASGSAGKS
jgi:rubrerythrin